MGKDVNIEIPQPFELDVDANMTTNSFLSMAPITVDMGLDDIKMDMEINSTVDMGLDNVNVDMGLDNVNVDMGLDNVNMCMSFAIKELPSMKMQFPVNFDFGIRFLGLPLLNFGICGKAMVLTEENSKRLFQVPKPPRFTASTPKGKDSLRVTIADNK
ncbi:hypothetical protein WIW50_10270 [Flavobacteriaceae bacterium 3-367]